MWPKPETANMAKSTTTETEWAAWALPHCVVVPSAQRGGQRLQRFSTKQTTTATVISPRFCPPASKRETQGRNRTENEHGSSKHATTRQQFANLTPKSSPNRLPLAHH